MGLYMKSHYMTLELASRWYSERFRNGTQNGIECRNFCGNQPYIMQPIECYQADLEAGRIKPDQEQAQVALQLNRLFLTLTEREVQRQSRLERVLGYLVGGLRDRTMTKGLYLWGGVGRGKTYLMDLFFDCLPMERKLRTHFYRFMQQVHGLLSGLQGVSDPLRQVAREIAGKAEVLCFDEFFVSDIADAMILGNLLDALIAEGVVLVTTSNVKPDLLYENGLQRERFLPAIALLKSSLTVVEFAPGKDYRLERLSSSPLYLSPIDDDTEQRLADSMRNLASGHNRIADHVTLTILDRPILARQCTEAVVWFEFSDLCQGPRSAFDYVELARLYQAMILSGVPQLNDERLAETRRFISLIDELYDRRVKLIVAAETDLPELYIGTRLRFEFERTRSRLAEMQSPDFLGSRHRI